MVNSIKFWKFTKTSYSIIFFKNNFPIISDIIRMAFVVQIFCLRTKLFLKSQIVIIQNLIFPKVFETEEIELIGRFFDAFLGSLLLKSNIFFVCF